MISEDTWTGWDMWFKSEFKQESLQILWKTSKREAYAGAFQSYVDAYVAESRRKLHALVSCLIATDSVTDIPR